METTENPARPLIVGAYAALPASRADQEALYAGLHDRGLADGLEIPDWALLGVSEADFAWFADQVRGRFRRSAITAIPGTMGRQSSVPGFGVASGDEEARTAAVAFLRELLDAADRLNQTTGEQSVETLQIRSAPSGAASREAFARSLAELAPEQERRGIRLAVEHCDAARSDLPGEKRFLPLAEEILLAEEHGVGITINWGRSALEDHDAASPAEHVARAAASGVLEGIVFSGAGPRASDYGHAWADAHLPLDVDEPTSLMDAAAVRAALAAGRDSWNYTGAKVQAPADADVEQRLAVVSHVVEAIRGA